MKEIQIKKTIAGFSGGSVVKNPPANAGDTGPIPDPGRSHVPWSNSRTEPVIQGPRAASPEPARPKACAPAQEKPLQGRGLHTTPGEQPRSPPAREKPKQQRDPSQPICT